MDRYPYRDRICRSDSAMDLPNSGRQYMSLNDLEDNSLVASPRMRPNYSQPWSALNTRYEADQTLERDTWTASVARSDESRPILPTGHHHNAYGKHKDYRSDLSHSSSGLESPSNCSVPPSPPTAEPLTSSSMTAPSSIILRSAHGDSGSVSCGQCDARYSGTYRRGTLGRHVLLKHPKGRKPQYACLAGACPKTFQRSDARLNHIRRKHPTLLHLLGDTKRASAQSESEPGNDSQTSRIEATETVDKDAAALYTAPSVASHEFDHMFSWWQQEKVGTTIPGGTTPGSNHPVACFVGELADPIHIMDGHSTDTSAIAFKSRSVSIGEPSSSQQDTKNVVELVMARLNFDSAAYTRTWVAFFSRWSYILQELLDQGSDAYPALAQIVTDVHAAFLAVNQQSQSQCQSRPRAPHSERPGPSGKGKQPLSPNRSMTSPSNRIGKASGRAKPHWNDSGSMHIVATEDGFIELLEFLVDCPIWKHHQMHGTISPCHGCSAPAMSHVRAHLSPVRTSTHRTENGLFPAFLAQCQRCKVDFIDSDLFDAHQTPTLSCGRIPRYKGDILTPWVRLYLKLYPNSSKVPLPWHGHSGWLPDILVNQCLASLPDSLLNFPFLGQSTGEAPVPALSLPTTPEATSSSAHTAMRDFVLADLMEPMHIHTSSLSPPNLNPQRRQSFETSTEATGPSSINASDIMPFADILSRMDDLTDNLNRSAMYLTPDQIQYTAYWCNRMHNIHRSFQASSASRNSVHGATGVEEDVGPTTTQHVSPTGPSTPALAPMLSLPHSQNPSSSTQTSSWYDVAGSSQQPSSAFTNASSFQFVPDFQYLDMNSPSLRRTLSRSSEHTPERSRLRPARPSRISLPDQNDRSPYLVPSAEQTPDEDFLSLPSKTRNYFS